MKKIIITIISILIVGLGGFVAWRYYAGKSSVPQAPISPSTLANNDPQAAQDNSAAYTDPDRRFSFTKPAGFIARSISDNDGETILIQKADNAGSSFQIFISSFDEPGPITPARIHKDVPDMIINNAQQAVVGKNKLTALIFKSIEPSIGETREMWLISDRYLYQITAPIALDSVAAEMMKTWESK